MDVPTISAAVSSLKAAGDIAKGLLNLHTMTEVQGKAIELNQKIIDAQHDILTAQAAQTALVERVRQLEGEIAAMKAWDAEKKRYKLASPATGAFVYALQRAMSNGEPPHYLCTNCFKQGKPSILTDDMREFRQLALHYWVCSNCDFKALTGHHRGACPPQYAEDLPAQG